MSCFQCRSKEHVLCQKCIESLRKNKLQEIKLLKLSIKDSQQKIQQRFYENLPQKSTNKFQKMLTQNFNNKKINQRKKMIKNQQLKLLIKQTKIKIKNTKKNIQNKLEEMQKNINQKKVINSANHQLKNKIKSMELQIEAKKKINQQNFKYLNGISREIKQNLYIVLELLHTNTQLFQSSKIFSISKAEELDCLMPTQDLFQSIVQIEHLDTVKVKKKANQKCLHIIIKNVLCFALTVQILNIWVPYKVCIPELKLDEVTINENKIIDFGASKHISNNIMQFFPSKIKNTISQNNGEDDQFQQLNQFQHLSNQRFNKRILGLNKNFLNSYQANLQYLSCKFGIQSRPIVFLQSSLIQKLFKASIMRNLNHQDILKDKIRIINIKYHSMLKQLKSYYFVQNYEKTSEKCNKKDEQRQFQHSQTQPWKKKISEFEYEGSQNICEGQQITKNDNEQKQQPLFESTLLDQQTVDSQLGESLYDIHENIRTTISKDSDQFQILE